MMDITDFLPAYSFVDSRIDDDQKSFYNFSSIIKNSNPYEFPLSTPLKKEFRELGLSDTQEIMKSNKFVPLKNQEFAARFLSPYSPYDKLIVFHEVGTGKCIAPKSNLRINSIPITIENLWNSFSKGKNITTDKDGGKWVNVQEEELTIESFDMKKICKKKILNLYKQYISEQMYII